MGKFGRVSSVFKLGLINQHQNWMHQLVGEANYDSCIVYSKILSYQCLGGKTLVRVDERSFAVKQAFRRWRPCDRRVGAGASLDDYIDMEQRWHQS